MNKQIKSELKQFPQEAEQLLVKQNYTSFNNRLNDPIVHELEKELDKELSMNDILIKSKLDDPNSDRKMQNILNAFNRNNETIMEPSVAFGTRIKRNEFRLVHRNNIPELVGFTNSPLRKKVFLTGTTEDLGIFNMAMPRKPTALKLVTGNPGRRPLPQNEPKPTGKPLQPKWLRGRAAKIWKEIAPQLFWLAEADSHKLAVWCGLYAEVQSGLEHVNSARLTQWRVLGSELGLDPSARARLTVKDDNGKADGERFFT